MFRLLPDIVVALHAKCGESGVRKREGKDEIAGLWLSI